MPVTKKIPGHWWSDKLLCLRAVRASVSSPGGFVPSPAAGPTCRAPHLGGAAAGQVGPLLLVWAPFLKGRILQTSKGGKPEAEGAICPLEARFSPRTHVRPWNHRVYSGCPKLWSRMAPPEAIRWGGNEVKRFSLKVSTTSSSQDILPSAGLFADLCGTMLPAPPILLSGRWKSLPLAECILQASASAYMCQRWFQVDEQSLRLRCLRTASTATFLALATINIFSAFQGFTFDPQSEAALSSADP